MNIKYEEKCDTYYSNINGFWSPIDSAAAKDEIKKYSMIGQSSTDGMVVIYSAPPSPKLARDNFDEEFDSMFAKNDKLMEGPKLKTSVDILSDCVKVQADRGVDYDKGEEKERSFAKTAKAFNAITGKDITPAEVCLILQIVKDVRQWSQDRLHEDSVLDGVSYASLKGEELYKQYGENK